MNVPINTPNNPNNFKHTIEKNILRKLSINGTTLSSVQIPAESLNVEYVCLCIF